MQTYYESKPALGSTVSLSFVTDAAPAAANDLMRRLWLEVFLFEKRCSRFLPNSELSQLNRTAGSRRHVSPELYEILTAAKRMGEQTAGLYNPFILPALQKAGYKQSLVPEYAGDPVDDHSAKRVVPVDSLDIEANSVAIPYGTALDLGGCGKGFLGDALAHTARLEGGLHGFWFSVGGDVVTYGLDGNDHPWRVSVSPSINQPYDVVAEVHMPDDGQYAVATSTTAFRRGQQAGNTWHHIIDPRTGQPARSAVHMITVFGESLLEADVLASCAIIAGESPGKAEDFLRHQQIESAMIGVFAEEGGRRRFQSFGSAIQLKPAGQYNTNDMQRAGL